MPHLASIASRAAILNFEVPRCQIIMEISAEILFVAVPKIKVSYLLNILPSGVGNINQLPVDEVFKKVPIGYGASLGGSLCNTSKMYVR